MPSSFSVYSFFCFYSGQASGSSFCLDLWFCAGGAACLNFSFGLGFASGGFESGSTFLNFLDSDFFDAILVNSRCAG